MALAMPLDHQDDLRALTDLSVSILTDDEDKARFLSEPRGQWPGQAVAVALPRSSAELAKVLSEAYRRNFMIVPQGGNTGLVGGQTLDADKVLVVSSQYLREHAQVDIVGNTMTLSAGFTLLEAQTLAEKHGRLFPLRLASEGSCTIGGNIATNAGGTQVLSYGNSRDLVLGIEAVLPSGEVIGGLKALRKDNTGYDLTNVLIGSEGTLAVITAVVLKLFAQPRHSLTFMQGGSSVQAVFDMFLALRDRFGSMLTAAELMPRIGVDLVTKHCAASRDPMASKHEWYGLFELSGACKCQSEAEALLVDRLDQGAADDIVLAQSNAQAEALWALRHQLSNAQAREAPSIKHDISVPLASLPDFVEEASAKLQSILSGVRPVFFGHMGDGNLHANVSMAADGDIAVFEAHRPVIQHSMHELVLSYQGSIAAEHGLGRAKSGLLHTLRTTAEIGTYGVLKKAYDPKGLMNPGVILP